MDFSESRRWEYPSENEGFDIMIGTVNKEFNNVMYLESFDKRLVCAK